MDNKKIFILDTNVILHDHRCIHHFENNDVVIPITVLEELDKFKKGNDPINYQARQFVRELDSIVGDELFNSGRSLGEGKGKLRIELGKPFSDEMKASFSENIPDHKILAIALWIKKQNESSCDYCKVALVTKDVNLRMKAKSLHLEAEDYKSDQVPKVDDLLFGIKKIDDYNTAIINELYERGEIPLEESGLEKLMPNQYLILRSQNSSVLAKYVAHTNTIKKVDKVTTYGIKPRNAEQTMCFDALLNPDLKLISITGKAGTGKTLLALAAALQQNYIYDQVMLARPIVALSNKDLGFLPGDAKEKVAPYMAPLFDNLSVIKRSFNINSQEFAKIDEMQKQERLIITALAFIRGRSLSNTFFIVDEAQNLTPHEVKTIITRAGEGTKIIFTGDIHQIDSPYLDQKSNGLAYLTSKMKGQEMFAHLDLVKGERSALAEMASNLL
ncbi:PhoH family protein [Halosquirtibacter laminarini]|uniref:PhoH family protein n=1 Tax=Halosquirtibacter laminarini TaxID=3374600 RepID=A0AC61NNW7_9BACT|nr:PhoH family protein [Prolixibacteraceae bacterium]